MALSWTVILRRLGGYAEPEDHETDENQYEGEYVRPDPVDLLFSETVSDVTERFYGEFLQNLRAWKAAPPKLKRPEKAEAVEVVADLVGVEPQAVAEDELPAEGVSRPEQAQ